MLANFSYNLVLHIKLKVTLKAVYFYALKIVRKVHSQSITDKAKEIIFSGESLAKNRKIDRSYLLQ